jgi:hypothetical protein
VLHGLAFDPIQQGVQPATFASKPEGKEIDFKALNERYTAMSSRRKRRSIQRSAETNRTQYHRAKPEEPGVRTMQGRPKEGTAQLHRRGAQSITK